MICIPVLMVVEGLFLAARFAADTMVCAARPFVSRRAFESGRANVSSRVAMAASTAFCPVTLVLPEDGAGDGKLEPQDSLRREFVR